MMSTFRQSSFSILRFVIRGFVYWGISLLGVNYDAVINEECISSIVILNSAVRYSGIGLLGVNYDAEINEEYISSIVILNSAVRYSGNGYLLAVMRNQFLVSPFRR